MVNSYKNNRGKCDLSARCIFSAEKGHVKCTIAPREAFRPPIFVLNLVKLCVDLKKKYLRTKIKNFDRRIQPP